MAEDTVHHLAANEAMQAVGWLLLAWGQLETRLSHGIYQMTREFREDLPPPPEKDIARTLTYTLKLWRRAHLGIMGEKTPHLSKVDRLKGEIEDASTMRNAICHGMDGVWTNPDPSRTVLCCFEKYHENRMIRGVPKQVFYDLPRLREELQRVNRFQVSAMKLDRIAVEALGAKPNKEAGRN